MSITNGMNLSDIELVTIAGEKTTFKDLAGKVTLVVNVASKCGLTPQYEALEALYERYKAEGLSVIGLPSNTFLQELGKSEEIDSFCKLNFGVTFPLTEKVHVNGPRRHKLYKELVKVKDDAGLAGPVMWNFEKFLILPNGEVKRFRPTTKPDDPRITGLIDVNL
jgi:glutathione peroxidase